MRISALDPRSRHRLNCEKTVCPGVNSRCGRGVLPLSVPARPKVPPTPREHHESVTALHHLVGADLQVPYAGGVKRYVNLDYAASTPVMATVWDAVNDFV